MFRDKCELLDGRDCQAIRDLLSDNPKYRWPASVKDRLLMTFVGAGCPKKGNS